MSKEKQPESDPPKEKDSKPKREPAPKNPPKPFLTPAQVFAGSVSPEELRLSGHSDRKGLR